MIKIPDNTIFLNVDIFNSEVLLFTSAEQAEEFEKLNDAEGRLIKHSPGSYFYGKINEQIVFVIIWRDETLDTIIHECVHMAHCIMECIGSPISLVNTEMEAYLVTYLFRQAIDKLRDGKNKRKKNVRNKK